jgi:hypothetical protein
MLRSVEEWYRSREISGVPKKYTHDVSLFDITVLLLPHKTVPLNRLIDNSHEHPLFILHSTDSCISLPILQYMDEFGEKYCDFPRVEKWSFELLVASFTNMVDNLETFRDDYQDTDSIRKGVEEWHLLAAQKYDQDAAVAAQIQSLGLREQAQ